MDTCGGSIHSDVISIRISRDHPSDPPPTHLEDDFVVVIREVTMNVPGIEIKFN